MRRYRVPELVAGFLLGFAILLIIFLSSSDIAAHYEVCEATKEGAKECATYNVLSYALHKVGAALNDYNGAITAIATAFIAWFTLSLRQSTDKLWDAGKDALETTERAFVFIDGFNIELTTSADDNRPDAIEHLPQTYRNDPGLFITRFAAQPRWKNSGTTPVQDLKIRVNWRGPEGPIHPDVSAFTYSGDQMPFFLGPQAVEASDVIEMTGTMALVNWQWNPVSPSPRMFIWGRADYRDVFGQPHFTEWCYQLRLSRPVRSERIRAQFIQWGEYNRTDEG
jgi:hypothetical protein